MSSIRPILERLKSHASIRRHAEMVRASGLFDPLWYGETYPDIRAAGIDPLLHYLKAGFRENRRPGPHFDPAWYRSQLSTVDLAIDPLVHFLTRGRQEGRLPMKKSDRDVEMRTLWKFGRFPGVPLDRPTEMRTAVHAPVASTDDLGDLLDFVRAFPPSVDLLISARTPECMGAVDAWARQISPRRVIVRLAADAQTDLNALASCFGADLLAHYDVFYHWDSGTQYHYNISAADIRRHNRQELCGTSDNVAQILNTFYYYPKIGVIAPLPHPDVSFFAFHSSFYKDREPSRSSTERYIDFPLGGTFWARPYAIRPLLDGSIAPAIALCVIEVAKRNGYHWLEWGVDRDRNELNFGGKNLAQYRQRATYASLLAGIDRADVLSVRVDGALFTRESGIVREPIRDAVKYARSHGKRIVLAGDAVSRESISAVLGGDDFNSLYTGEDAGIEYGSPEMWRMLVAREAGGKSILHLESDPEAFLTLSAIEGVKGFYVMSADDLFATSRLSRVNLSGDAEGVPPALGPSIATYFNDPFEGRP